MLRDSPYRNGDEHQFCLPGVVFLSARTVPGGGLSHAHGLGSDTGVPGSCQHLNDIIFREAEHPLFLLQFYPTKGCIVALGDRLGVGD
jgi:hypothetical protein